MKERKKVKRGKDDEVNRQGGKRGAPAPLGTSSSLTAWTERAVQQQHQHKERNFEKQQL